MHFFNAFTLAYFVFIFLCGWGGYTLGSRFGTLGAIVGAILGAATGYLILVGHLIYGQFVDWWKKKG